MPLISPDSFGLASSAASELEDCGVKPNLGGTRKHSPLTILERVPVAAALIDPLGVVLATNAALDLRLGYDRGELIGAAAAVFGSEATRLLEPDHDAAVDIIPLLVPLNTRSGHQQWSLVSVSVWDLGEPGTRLLCATNCDSMVESERRLGRIAFLDSLTGLPNRAAFVDRLNSCCTAADRGRYAVARIDLDRFRLVNDTHGHEVGDRLLVRIAARLGERIEKDEMLARLGEDEFVVLLADGSVKGDLRQRLAHILTALSGAHDLHEGRVYLTASVGAVRISDQSCTAEALLNDADSALYRAKDDGRNRIHVFERDLHEQTRSRLVVFGALQRALRDRELEVHVQPIVDGRSGALVSMEALVRWPQGFDGACQPAQFIPLSEELGIAPELDRMVIEESARWLAYLRQAHPRLRATPININVSAVTLRNEAIVDLLAAAREQYGLEAAALRVEITETALLSDSEHVQTVLCDLARSGTPLVLDDFGTGYSSLRHVYDLPICALKIDKYFVNRALIDPRSLALVSTILTLARSLGISTTAEGIEYERQRSTLVRLGCQNLQGYLFAKPMPPADLPAWLEQFSIEVDRSNA